jgi:hypothetical protein
MTTYQIGKRLVELCNAGEYSRAVEELYADDCTHVEAAEMPHMPRVMTGKDALLDSTKQWVEKNEIHSSETVGPFPHDDRFICIMKTEITPKEGPMAGRRMALHEACEYHVRDGRIVKAEFFYPTE